LEQYYDQIKTNKEICKAYELLIRFWLGKRINNIIEGLKGLTGKAREEQFAIRYRMAARLSIGENIGIHVNRSLKIFTIFQDLDSNILLAVRNVRISLLYDLTIERAQELREKIALIQ
jgi:hypothetical protein